MKYAILFNVFFAVYSFASTSICKSDLSADILGNISCYLKKSLDIEKNDPILRTILNISWFSRNDFHLYLALSNNFRPFFDQLPRPFILYLARISARIDNKDQEIAFNSHIYSHRFMTAMYFTEKCQFDLAFEFLKDYPYAITKWYSILENRAEFFEALKADPSFVEVIKNALKSNFTFNTVRWLTDCIVYDAPDNFYLDFFDERPRVLESLDEFLIQSDIESKEYPRIYKKLKWLNSEYFLSRFNQQDENNIKTNIYNNLFYDICFGTEDVEIDLASSLKSSEIYFLTKSAFHFKKEPLFSKMLDKYKVELAEYIHEILILEEEYYSIKSAADLEFILIILEVAEESVREVIIKSDIFLGIIQTHYLTKSISYHENQYKFEFINPKAISEAKYINANTVKLEISSPNDLGFMSFYTWANMKTFNEELFVNFLSDFEKLPLKKKSFKISIEFFKFITEASYLTDSIIKMGIKFSFEKDTEAIDEILKFPNLEVLKQILDINWIEKHFKPLKTKSEYEKFEEITGKSVVDHFFREVNSKSSSLNDNDYFKWRSLFIYWINGSEKMKIKGITSPAILNLLKLEFEKEMNEILNENNKGIEEQTVSTATAAGNDN